MIATSDTAVIRLCTEGLKLEVQGNIKEAIEKYMQAWHAASSHQEKYLSAHHIIKHQETVHDKLRWNETALDFILQMQDEEIKSLLPSLYYNIANCYELLYDTANAHKNYTLAHASLHLLPEDGYDETIKDEIIHKFQHASAQQKKLRSLW